MDEGRIRNSIHVDMDAFYASVEQRDDATLKGKPVAVGYPAKRGVVAAASYEARSFGVRSAMLSTVAARKCAELVFVPPRFDVYREVSKQVQAIFKDYTPNWSSRSLLTKPTSTQSQRHPDRVGDCQGDQSAHLRGDQAYGLGRNFLQQVPSQARIGHSQAERPVRDHARL
jgi:hypothetical protein